jgi:hypothetical protein
MLVVWETPWPKDACNALMRRPLELHAQLGIMQIYRVQLSGVSTMYIGHNTLHGVYQGACKSQWTFLGYVTYVGIERMGS